MAVSFCTPKVCKEISRWWSAAKPPDDDGKKKPHAEGVQGKPIPAHLRRAKMVLGYRTGGFAALHHRLISRHTFGVPFEKALVMNLEQILSQVSKNCLCGQPVPHDLALLWKAQLGGDHILARRFALTLIDEIGDNLFYGYRESDGIPPDLAKSYQEMFDQIAFVAKVEDGALIGYWLGKEDRPVAQSPIIELDNEGQFSLKGTSIAHYFLEMTEMDSPQEFSKVKNWLEKLGIPVSVRNHDEIWALTETFDDPNELSWAYQAGSDGNSPSN